MAMKISPKIFDIAPFCPVGPQTPLGHCHLVLPFGVLSSLRGAETHSWRASVHVGGGSDSNPRAPLSCRKPSCTRSNRPSSRSAVFLVGAGDCGGNHGERAAGSGRGKAPRAKAELAELVVNVSTEADATRGRSGDGSSPTRGQRRKRSRPLATRMHEIHAAPEGLQRKPISPLGSIRLCALQVESKGGPDSAQFPRNAGDVCRRSRTPPRPPLVWIAGSEKTILTARAEAGAAPLLLFVAKAFPEAGRTLPRAASRAGLLQEIGAP
jgi:hypothetical protein